MGRTDCESPARTWRIWLAALGVAMGLLASAISGCALGRAAPAPQTPRPALTLAVMGASDAWGIGTHDPDQLNWPSQLADDLPQSTRLTNLGVPGATLAQAYREQLPVALDERPRALVLWLAVNDIIAGTPLATYDAELRQTLSAVSAQSPRSLVFVGNVPDLTQIPYFGGWDATQLRREVAAWNLVISRDCARVGATLVDLYSVWGQIANHPDYISDDGLHPSDRGAAAVALVFAVAIEQRLRQSL
jgi:acyl-CoA thioesterase I